MRMILTYILLFFCLKAIGQNQRMLSYNLFDGTVDTIDLSDFDTTIVEQHTNYFIGNIDNDLNALNEEVPTENIYTGSNFTRKKQASTEYDINDFPIRTSVKLFKWENDSLKNKCSGSIISRKHVLTACHCVAYLNHDSLLYDSLYVSPVFDNGEFNTIFEGSWVKRIYIFENWNFGKDFSILELENPIGDNAGWVSIGFDSDDNNLLDGIFYKFSYPAISLPQIDPNSYNGDTLYYGYGLADIASENNLMIDGASGIPGESGSSIIKIQNDNSYISYGVLSFSANLNHCRLSNWKYFALKEVIKNDLNLSTPELKFMDNISIYPNPVNDMIHISLPEKLKNNTLSVLNSQGRIIKIQSNASCEIELNLADLPIGIYLLRIESENRIVVRKMIKSGGLH